MPRFKKRFLILGTGQLAVDLCQVILSEKRWSAEIVGFLDERKERVGERVVGSDVVGTYGQVSDLGVGQGRSHDHTPSLRQPDPGVP